MRVGTRSVAHIRHTEQEDHPHACGDKIPAFANDFKAAGSSPCVWGQVPCDFCRSHKFGIIPMRVGTSSIFLIPCDFCRDHPHACGDKGSNDIAYLLAEGSSPCVWGQARYEGFRLHHRRIIPMRVGTSNRFPRPLRSEWDHPHACGDKTVTKSYQVTMPGSSPCVWGQDQQVLH